jgi:type VI secretion system secreted protein Hcp
MAVDMFLKVSRATGESKDKVHTKEIDVLSWSWGKGSSPGRR